ncbi:MAG: trigger factor [Candidatus Nanopelagicaceae bacterium]
MKSSVENLSPTRVRFDITIEFNEMSEHVADAYKKVASQVNIPGFRKGKVPPAMIDQRVGRGAVLDEAINAALPDFYTKAAREHQIAVIGRPEVDIKEFVDNEKLNFTIEVDVRPEIKLPDFSKIEIVVDDVSITEAEINEQVDSLRARFGTLHVVERVAKTGDFVNIDLVAKVNGEEVEGGTANDISYEVGSNSMVEGLDEAVVGLKVDESKIFETTLLGMQEGETGSVTVTVKSVKERELPTLDDAFAKLASEFDTLAELKEDISKRLERVKALEQGAQARDKLVDKLLSELEIPVPEKLVEEEIHAHLEREGRLDDAEHRAEVDRDTRQMFKQDFLLDEVVKAEAVDVTEVELTEYVMRTASRYGMAPQDFANRVAQSGGINQMLAEVARAKALANILNRVSVVTESGKKVDLEALAPKRATEPTEEEK